MQSGSPTRIFWFTAGGPVCRIQRRVFKVNNLPLIGFSLSRQLQMNTALNKQVECVTELRLQRLRQAVAKKLQNHSEWLGSVYSPYGWSQYAYRAMRPFCSHTKGNSILWRRCKNVSAFFIVIKLVFNVSHIFSVFINKKRFDDEQLFQIGYNHAYSIKIDQLQFL